MKKIVMAAVFAASVLGLQAQDTRPNAVKLNPLSLVFATGNVAYERAVSENHSFQVGAFYSGLSISGVKYAGFGVTPEFRFYFAGAKEALNGVYAAPFVRYQNFSLKEKETNTKTTFSSIGGGATIGWQKMWNGGFVLDIFAGPAYNAGKFKNSSDEESFDVSGAINGFGLRTGITIGFGF